MRASLAGVVAVAAVLCVAAAYGASAVSGDPSKPVWPTNFQTPFGLYVAFPSVKNASAEFYYKYDSEAQVQLLDYQEHCIPLVHWNAEPHPCKIYFQPSGIYVHQPATGLECCQLVADVGAVPPDFLAPFNFSKTENDIIDYYGRSHNTNYWTGPGDFGYWTDITTGFDVRFKDGPTGILWYYGDFTVKPQDLSIFKLPDPNCSKKCGFLSGTESMSVEEQLPLFADPMVRLAMKHHVRKQQDAGNTLVVN